MLIPRVGKFIANQVWFDVMFKISLSIIEHRSKTSGTVFDHRNQFIALLFKPIFFDQHTGSPAVRWLRSALFKPIFFINTQVACLQAW